MGQLGAGEGIKEKAVPQTSTTLPETIASVEQLEELLSEPTEGVVETLAGLDGDLIVLGVGGKIGPTLARLADLMNGRWSPEPPAAATARRTAGACGSPAGKQNGRGETDSRDPGWRRGP